MQQTLLIQWVRALLREVLRYKWIVAGCYAVVSLVVLIVGIVWPRYYVSAGIIHADRQNIIAPLLRGSAEITEVGPDDLKLVQELIYSPRIMEAVAKQVGFLKGDEDSRRRESVLNSIRGKIKVNDVGKGYVGISYSSSTADESFRLANAVIDNFIRENAQSKRKESKEAYSFIDRQVKSYKQQLQEAEARLKQFRADNLDGTEESVNARLAQLRSSIEEINLNLQDARTRRAEINGQLSRESRIVSRNYKADVYRERLSQAQAQLDTLRLSYEDTYPDIVVLKQQIADLRKAIEDTENDEGGSQMGGSNTDSSANPLYAELRSQLGQVEVEIRTFENRLQSTKKLLDTEYGRAKRVAEGQADLSELSRDYDVTRGIYEDMLERKERARLSMTLDLEGQGVNYKIQEPPSYPALPSGLRFVHFAMAGVFVGAVVAIGLVAAYIQFDPRVRFTVGLMDQLPVQVPVLGTVPHIATPVMERISRKDIVQVSLFLIAVLSIYAAVIVIKVVGNF